jgi:hypothetical protein
MPAAVLVVAALLLGTSLPASAGVELLLGWDARTNWNSNVLRDETDEESDFSIYTGPDLVLRSRTGDLRYDLSYRPRYEAFLELEDADAFEHYAEGELDWSITRRTELSLSNRFAQTRTLGQLLEDPDPVLLEGEVVIDRSEILRNTSSAALVHQLSARNSLDVNVNYGLFEYDNERRSDARSLGGSATVRRALDRRQTAGIGAAITRQDFLESIDRPESGTTIFEGFAVYRAILSRSVTFSLSGGPRWSLQDELDAEQPFPQYATTGNGFLFRASCAAPGAACTEEEARAPFFLSDFTQVPPQPVASVPITSLTFEDGAPEEELALNYSAAAVLAYRRERYGAELSYTRRENPNSGTGLSTNLDVVSLRGSWEPARRWRLSFVASWQKQASDSSFPRRVGVLSADGATVFLDADRNPVADPADAVFAVADVGEFVVLRSVGEGSSEFESTAYRVALRADHDLTRRLKLRAGAFWWQQTTEQTGAVNRTIENIRFELGFTWTFTPIVL